MIRTISNTFVVNTIEDGENTSALDIDNEYDGVNTDSTQKILFAKTVSTIVRLYDGGTEVDIKNMGVNTASGISVTNMPLPSIATFSSSAESGGHGKVLSWAFIAGQTMSESYNVTISLTYNNVPYTATFTIKASKGQAVFNLKPSYSALPCKKVNGTITIPNLSLNVEVTDSNTPILLTSFDSDGAVTYNTAKYYVVYSFDQMPATKTPSETQGAEIKKWPSGNSVTIPTSDTPTNVYIAIFNSSDVLLDRETVPIVEDGEDGTSPYMADLDNEMDAIACNNVGTPLTQTYEQVTTTVSMWYGSQSLDMEISVYDTSSSSTQYSNGHSYISSEGISVAWNDTTGVITARFRKQYNNTDVRLSEKKVFCIKIKSTNISSTGSIIRYLYFTVNCMRGAAVYQLVPSVNKITKHSNGTYTPSTTEYITCAVTKLIGGVTVTAPQSEYSLTYSLDGGTTESAYTQTGVRVGLVTSNLIFILKVPNSNGILADKETIPVITDGEDGESGHDVNPNILLDTAEYKTGEYNSSTNPNGKWFHLNGVNSGEFEGRVARLVTINNTTGEGSTYRRVAEQQIATTSSNLKLQADTWYTFSAYFKRYGSANYASMSLLDATGYIDSTFERDGVTGTYTSGDLTYTISINNDTWTRHTLTFKTKASMSSQIPMYVSTRHLGTVGGVYVAMMKLEQGKYATAYMANEDDLKGADGQNGQNGQNGADGQDAATVVVTPSQVLFNAKSNGKASGTQYFTLNYGLYVNNVACSVASAEKVTLSLPTNVNLNGSKGKSSSQIYITDDTAVSTGAIIQISIEGTLSGKTYNASTSIPVAGVRAGADGSRGKVGRAYYYAGEWDELASSFQFIVNDTQAPYFGYQPSGSTHGYYVFNPETNGTYVKSSVVSTYGNPSANNAPWSKMNDQQEYIITKAIFGPYAQFGGSIINQDWLMSVHGDVNVAWRRNTKIESYTSISAGNIYSPTWIGQFWAKTGGTHKFYINYECNGYPFTIILWDRSVESNNSIFSQYISSDGGAVNKSPYLYSGHQYLLCAYKSSSSNPNPVITNVTMDTPVPSGSTFPTGNYLYLDPMTGGAETILSDNEITVSTNSSIDYQTIVAYDMPLASLSSYYFYFELKGSNTTSRYVYWYLDRKENGSWVQRFSSDNNSRFTVNKADWTEYKFNLGFDSNAGGQYRLRIYASSSTVIMRKVSIAAGASFAPQFGVDLYRGTVSMNNVHVRGTIDAIDGNFSGTVSARLFYAKTCYVSGNYTINLETEPYYTYYSSNDQHTGTGQITLPNPSTYDGVELRFYCSFPTRSASGTNIYYSGGIYTTDSGGFLSLYPTLSLKKNRFATVKAMKGYWYVVDDGVETPDSNVPSIEPDNPEIDEQE